jgi:hypothetical protein
LPWSLKLIERFEARWDWDRLSGNESLHLPTLRPADIVAIMEFKADIPPPPSYDDDIDF